MGYGGKGYGYTQAGYGYGTSEFTGFDGLSIIPDTLGWWSVARRVLNRYTGPAIRLRRSSDSAEQDFYGIGPQGEVSTAELRAWNGWNLLRHTEAFDNVYWTKGDASVTAATPPSGYSQAWKLGETATSALHYIGRGMSDVYTASTQYTLSVVAKAAERTAISLVAESNGDLRCDFNLSNGTFQNIGVGANGAIQSLGDGWYRCSMRFTAADTGGATTYLAILQAVNGSLVYSGSLGSGVLITGFQLERASAFSTYEPRTTTGAGDSFLVTLYDQSGLARHFTQSTTTLQPIICEQGVPVTENGRLAAKFVAADARRMSIASSTAMFNALHSTGGSILGVWRYNNTASGKQILTNQNADSGIGFRLTDGSGAEIQGIVVANGSASAVSVAKTGVSTDQSIVAWVIDPDNATAADREDAWRNGALLATDNAATATPSTSSASADLTLGARTGGTNSHDGTISEVAAFSALISTADRTTWQSRSGNFYGVTIS